MKKLNSGQILFARSPGSKVRVMFYEVIKATTNTCELREMRKHVVEQSYDEQEVVPISGEYTSKPFRRRVLPTGCAQIEADLHAWPWDGKSQWQSILIFIP